MAVIWNEMVNWSEIKTLFLPMCNSITNESFIFHVFQPFLAHAVFDQLCYASLFINDGKRLDWTDEHPNWYKLMRPWKEWEEKINWREWNGTLAVIQFKYLFIRIFI